VNKATLQNLIIFMNRVPVTGQEAFAWAETFATVNEELAALNAPPKAPDAPTPPTPPDDPAA
jgi:hypothetical protein